MNLPLAYRTLGGGALATCLAALTLATTASASQYPPGPGNCCPDTLTVLNIQNPFAVPHPVAGDVVRGAGGIITGFDLKPSGFALYVQMSNGLPYSGVGVFTSKTNLGPGTPANLQLGDSVVVYGKVAELQGGTAIGGTHSSDDDLLSPTDGSPASDVVVRLVTHGQPLPAFHVGTLHELREPASNTAAEPWEGMLVRLVGPLMVAPVSHHDDLGVSSSFMVVDPACGGPNCDSVFVDGSTLATITPPAVGTILGGVQGIFEQRAGGYRIQLRDAGDLTITPPPSLVDAFPIFDNNLAGAERMDSILVVFDRPLDKTSAEDVTHYALSSGGTINGARLLDAPDDNRVVMQIRNQLQDGDGEGITVTGVTSGLARAASQVRTFINGVLDLPAIQSPDPASLAGALCADRSRFAGAGSSAGSRASFQGTVTGAFGNLYALQDGTTLRAGLWVVSPGGPLTVGHAYLLTATIQELAGGTEGTNNSYVRDLGSATVPDAAVQSVHVLRDGTCDLAQLFVTGQDYEGMLVTIPRVEVSGTQPAGTSFYVASPGVVPPEQILVAAAGGNFTFAADSGGIASITGVLRQSAGGFAIYPRSDYDIQSFGASPTFSVPLDASKAATSSRDPDIVRGANGALLMAWGRNFHQTVHSVSLDNGDNWSIGRAIPRQGIQPAVAVADSNKFCVLSVGTDSLLFHESADGGFAMDPILTTVDRAPTLYPALTVGGGGHLHAAWERPGTGIFYARSFSGGASFSGPVPIAQDSVPWESHSMVRICASRGDSVYVFWQYEMTGEPLIQKVLFSRSLNGGGSFSAPRAVRDEKNPLNSTVKLAVLGDAQVDENGKLYVMGMEEVDFGAMERVALLSSSNGGTTFELVGEPPSPSESGVCAKSLVVGPHGAIHALVATCGNALFYTRSLDGGATWTSAVNITGNTGPIGEPRGAKIILDSTGTPAVVWFGTVGGSTEIYFSRLLN